MLNKPTELFTKKETAARLQIHPATLDRYVRAGQLGSIKFGSLVFFTEKDIEQFIHCCHRKPKTKPVLVLFTSSFEICGFSRALRQWQW